MNKHLLTLFALFLFINSPAQKTNKRELRGAWISTYLGLDWPVRSQTPTQQRAALLVNLDHHKATGLNTVYFQVRSQSDAMYPSTIEPWSYDLTGNQNVAPSPLWDPLQFALEESRKRGFEFHAWINPFRAVGNTGNEGIAAQYSPAHISKTHPEWMLTVGTVKIINPGIAAARAYVVSVIADILNRYDVDGIHFDDYFYPSGTINDNAAYTADPRGFPNTTTGRADWRRDNINLFIQEINNLIQSTKPWVKFGVSPTGIYRSSTNPAIGSATSSGALQHYSAYFADTKRWLQEGWVDYIAPQVYWYIGQTGSDYSVLIPWWNNQATNGRHIYIGIAAYKVNDASMGLPWTSRSQIPDQVRMNRNSLYPNVHGGIYFRTQHLKNNPLNFRDSLRLHFYNKPALQPTMPWKDNEPPQPATFLNAVKYSNDSVVLNWTKPAAAANELDRVRQFVVYRSTNPIVDINDPQNILAITGNDTTAFRDITIAPNTVYYYAVTAIDRMHNESVVSNTTDNLPPVVVCPAGQELELNASCNVTLPDYRSMAMADGVAAHLNTALVVTQSPAAGTVINGTGNTTVTITATDRAGNSGNCSFQVERKDAIAPVISGASVNLSQLLVPNHKMKTIIVSYNANDNCGYVISSLSVSSNEPVTGLSNGDIGPDWEIINTHTVKLRAERSGSGNGRIYTITITAIDASGNISTEDLMVTVPHDHSDVLVKQVNGAKINSEAFGLRVLSNPAPSNFILNTTAEAGGIISIRILNSIGQIVETLNVSPGSNFTIGTNYKSGVYFVEAFQGNNRRSLKLVKL
jgi:uncharacterized lipoprotein YddW (UPF0748 family)